MSGGVNGGGVVGIFIFTLFRNASYAALLIKAVYFDWH